MTLSNRRKEVEAYLNSVSERMKGSVEAVLAKINTDIPVIEGEAIAGNDFMKKREGDGGGN